MSLDFQKKEEEVPYFNYMDAYTGKMIGDPEGIRSGKIITVEREEGDEEPFSYYDIWD